MAAAAPNPQFGETGLQWNFYLGARSRELAGKHSPIGMGAQFVITALTVNFCAMGGAIWNGLCAGLALAKAVANITDSREFIKFLRQAGGRGVLFLMDAAVVAAFMSLNFPAALVLRGIIAAIHTLSPNTLCKPIVSTSRALGIPNR